MTAREYIDETKLNLLRVGFALELDDAQLLTYVNRAREETQRAVYGLYPERYSNIATFVLHPTDILNGIYDATEYGTTSSIGGYKSVYVQKFQLDRDFIEPYNVIIRWSSAKHQTLAGGKLWATNCRLSDIRELSSAQNHAWNMPTVDAALYAVKRDGDDYYLYVCDLKPIADDVLSGDVSLEIWQVLAVPRLEDVSTDDVETATPPHLEKLIIDYATIFALESEAESEAANVIRDDINKMREFISRNYSVKKQRVGSLLPSKEGVA